MGESEQTGGGKGEEQKWGLPELTALLPKGRIENAGALSVAPTILPKASTYIWLNPVIVAEISG